MHDGKQIDHARYPLHCRGLSDAELFYLIQDCRATLDAWPDGPNAGYYMDEIHYAGMEIQRRRRGGHRDPRYVDFHPSPLVIE